MPQQNKHNLQRQGAPACNSLEQTTDSRKTWIALAILGVPAIGLALVVIYSAEIMEVLRRHFPEGAVPQATIFFGLAGLTMTWVTISNLREAAAGRRWPVTRGRIVRSEVEMKWLFASATRGAAVRTYQPLVEYQYTVNGREYHSRRRRLGATVTTGEAIARAEAARFPAGAHVEVHYDPRKPGNAVLEMGVAFKPRTFLIIVVFFGLAFYFSGIF
jgi:hypothetical protein